MKSKKAAEKLVWIVASIVFVLFVLFVYTNVWANLFGKSATEFGEQIGTINDKDSDTVINIADKCPCVKGVQENYGCPSDYKIKGTDKDLEDKSCLTKKT